MNVVPKLAGGPLTDDRAVLDVLRGSEFVQKATAARAAQVLNFRKAAAKKLADLETSTAKLLTDLRAAREAAIEEARAAEIRWREASNNAQRAQNALSSASHNFSSEQIRLENQLVETANPEITLFLSEMYEELEKALKSFAFHHHIETKNVITGSKTVITVNNKTSVLSRREAIREAIAAAEAMRLDPDQSAVSERLQELRQALPAIKGL